TATASGGARISVLTSRAYLYVPGVAAGATMLFNTTVEAVTAGAAGNAITLTAVGDAGAGAGTINDATTDVVLHFKPRVSTVADMEALIGTSTHIRVKTPGTGARVLTASDAFASAVLSHGNDACWDLSNTVNTGILLDVGIYNVVAGNTIDLGS